MRSLLGVPPEVDTRGGVEAQRIIQRARRRAERRLAAMYPSEFAILFHEEKHAENCRHHHSPDNPETIPWWGLDRGSADGDGAQA